jgi:hypothetical protein
MNSQRVTLLVLLDLSSAFDTVDHAILLKRSNTDFGIHGTVLDWYRTYLFGRSQHISLNGAKSDSFDLKCEVPQGSCFGPLLFIMYASKLFEVVRTHLPDAHGFADDTQLYLSFKPDSSMNQAAAVCAMENCIAELRQWMLQDKLKTNDDKTEFIFIGSRQLIEKIDQCYIRVGDANVQPVTSARNLR